MEIIAREYRPADAAGVTSTLRSSFSTLRQSKGGKHPEKDIDNLLRASDKELIDGVQRNTVTLVAVVKGTGEVAGLGSLGRGWFNLLLGNAYSKNLFVKEDFQKGKAGVSVGRVVREATLAKAESLGIRKIYGHSTPEAVRFHEKFNARFFPQHDFVPSYSTVPVKYYEIILRPSPLNNLPIEGYLCRFEKLYPKLMLRFKRFWRSILGRHSQ
jgi:hypothetical protein